MATCGPPGYQPIMLMQCPIAHDPQAYYNPQAEPFRAYLDSLPPWDGDEYIRVLASSVTVAGGFEKLGFEEVIVDGTPGYIAVVRTDDEMKARASMMAMQAKGGKT